MEIEDENISTLLSMGFPDIVEIRRALRLAKNDLSEAVAILTNEQILSFGKVGDMNLDVEMKESNTDDNLTVPNDALSFEVCILFYSLHS